MAPPPSRMPPSSRTRPMPSPSRTPPTSPPSRTPPMSPPARTSLPTQGISACNDATALGAHRYTEATLEVDDEHGFSHTYSTSDTSDIWTLYIHCKRGLPDMEYVMFKIDRADVRMSILTTIKDQLGYAVRDFLYYKKRCGRDVATLQAIEYNKHVEIMVQENEREKEIRLVLSQEEETTQQVSITPLKRPRQQQPEEDEHPFMDEPIDAYMEWLKKQPKDKYKNLKEGSRIATKMTYKEYLKLKGDIPQIMAFVEQRDSGGITFEDDESNGSNVTPPSNRPSHARKKREERNGDGSNQHKKRGRGVVKGLAVTAKRVKERTQKLPIEFGSRGDPIGPNTRAFIDEVVLSTRNWAPLIGVNSWKGINEGVKEEIAEEILLTWNFINIATEDEKKEIIWKIARERYKGWRAALSATYKLYNNYGERIQNKPEEIDLFEWHYLLLYFGTDEFKKVSTQNSSNRQQQKTQHVSGSMNFSQRSFDMRDKDTGEEPSDHILWKATHTKHGKWSNSASFQVYENAALKMAEIESEPNRQALSAAEENMIFQSCYKETTQIKSSKVHGHGYMAKYRTRRDLMKENLEVHARAEAAAKEKRIAYEVEIEKLKEQLAHEAAEREREKEENRRKMQEDLQNAKNEMRQEMHKMVAQHKNGTMNQSTPQNNDNIQIEPTTQEGDETDVHANDENEDALQQTQPGSVVTVQRAAEPPTARATTSATNVSKNLLKENTANVAAPKKFVTTQQLMNRTRNSKKK